ncbi:MAG: M48 family metallopeptidase [Fimbriimonadaceae bacterium]|nr:M48 family metallopeptidase [Fimbriimonadaceae bacterium]
MRRSLHEQIAANKRASFIYATFLVILLAGIGATTAGLYKPEYWPLGAGGAALLGLIVALVARYAGSKIILTMSGAREATGEEHRVLNNVAEEMAIAAGIPVPKVMVIDDSAPNAFATGPDPNRAVVVFTTGIIAKLDREELQGVMAHEIGHIRNYDIRFMTTIAMVAGLIPLFADGLRRSLWYGGGRRSRGSGNSNDNSAIIFMVLAILLAILAPLFAKLLELAVSRQREFLADATAAELTRYPEGLARALEKISGDHEHLESANRATQHMYIVNPMKLNSGGASLFSTHPPIQERLKRLRGTMGHRAEAPKDWYDPLDEVESQVEQKGG